MQFNVPSDTMKFQWVICTIWLLVNYIGSTSVYVGKSNYFGKLKNTRKSIRKIDHSQEGFFLDDIEAVSRSGILECPSSNVISTHYKCQVNDTWVDCFRKHCCKGYNFVAGRCLPENIDPCSQNVCEQKCSVFFGRVICTCYSGYKFNAENHKNGITPVCKDINECDVKNGGCDHVCTNSKGSYTCSCKTGYYLDEDKKSCLLRSSGAIFSVPKFEDFSSIIKPKPCYSSCSTVITLEEKIQILEEKITALSTAVRLYSFAAGPPGPNGPVGPPGPRGLRGFPGAPGSPGSSAKEDIDDDQMVYDNHQWTQPDSWIVNARDEFCTCRMGPVGPTGAPGKEGAQGLRGQRGDKGEKGDRGSFDFLMLIVADLKHDIRNIQDKVFTENDWPESFDLINAMESNQHSSENQMAGYQVEPLQEAFKKEDFLSFSRLSTPTKINSEDTSDTHMEETPDTPMSSDSLVTETVEAFEPTIF